MNFIRIFFIFIISLIRIPIQDIDDYKITAYFDEITSNDLTLDSGGELYIKTYTSYFYESIEYKIQIYRVVSTYESIQISENSITENNQNLVIPVSGDLLIEGINKFRFIYTIVGKTYDEVNLDYEIVLNPNLKTIEIEDENFTYNSVNNQLYYKRGKITQNYEIFEFINFVSDYDNLLYNCVKFPEWKIKYQNYKNNGDLTINFAGFVRVFDPLFQFQNVGKLYDDDYIELKLKLIKDNEYYLLKLDEEFYVNPMTLVMSSTKENGYVKTDNLYLPLGMYETYRNTKMVLFLTGLGNNRYSFIQNFSILFSANEFGYCSTSGYCIGSTTSEPDFTLGTNSGVSR